MNNAGSLGQSIHSLLKNEIARIIEEESIEAGKRVEKRVKERTAEICATVLQQYSMQYLHNQLIISVDFNHIKQ